MLMECAFSEIRSVSNKLNLKEEKKNNLRILTKSACLGC